MPLSLCLPAAQKASRQGSGPECVPPAGGEVGGKPHLTVARAAEPSNARRPARNGGWKRLRTPPTTPVPGDGAGGREAVPPLEIGQPPLVLPLATRHHGEKSLLQRLRHRTALAGADPAVVDLSDGRHFGRSPRQEHFVRHVELVAGERRLCDLHALVLGELDHGRTRNPVEDGGERRRADGAVTHEKQVLAARLCYQALCVEENRLVVPIEQRLAL